jgi:hypothetical protein
MKAAIIRAQQTGDTPEWGPTTRRDLEAARQLAGGIG